MQSMASENAAESSETLAAPDDSPLEAAPRGLPREVDERDIEELDRVLELAEDIQGRIGELESRRNKQAMIAVLASAGIVVTVATWELMQYFDALSYGAIVSAVCVVFGLFASRSAILTERRRVMERRSLAEVLAVAREVEQGLAVSGNLRPLTRARIRIRISRFRLGVYRPTFEISMAPRRRSTFRSARS